MSWPDAVNGAFEMTGGLAICLSIRRLYADKRVAGVDWRTNMFFTLWGLWNLYYYPSLDQWLSFWGGVAIVVANTAWLCMLGWYSLAQKRHADQGLGGHNRRTDS